MTQQVARILEELREDHRNMALMLDLLELEAGRIHNGDEPDYELLHDIMNYMTVYSDAVHHPKEGLIYAKLWAKWPNFSSGLERVEDDHQALAVLGQSLRSDIESIMAGTAITRDRIIADTLDYVGRLREHLDWEEGELFPRADELVTAVDAVTDAVTVDTTHLDAEDPVFGQAPEAMFANLLRSIREIAEERNLKVR